MPTLEEAGFPGAAVTGWSGRTAPAGTPAAAVDTLSNALKLTLANADLRGRLAQQATKPRSSAPTAFAAFALEERERFAKIIEDAHVTAD